MRPFLKLLVSEEGGLPDVGLMTLDQSGVGWDTNTLRFLIASSLTSAPDGCRFGAPTGTPEWQSLFQRAQPQIRQPYLSFFIFDMM